MKNKEAAERVRKMRKSLGKVVASGQSAKLLEEFRSGEFGGGSSKAFHRIFSLAFGAKAPAPAHR